MRSTISYSDPLRKNERAEKGRSLISLPASYTVVDLETTGLNPHWNDIIEFGAMRVTSGIVSDSYASLVNPGYKIDKFITELTGITNEMLGSAPRVTDILPEFLNFVGDSIIIGHNVNFDINFIYDTCRKVLNRSFSNDFVDTMRLSRRLFPQESHHRLCDLVKRFAIDKAVEHRALADVEQTNRCYLYMKRHMEENGIAAEALLPQSAKNLTCL